MLFYVLIVFAVLFRHRTNIATAALGVVMSYSATACIHLFTLLAFYEFSFGSENYLSDDIQTAIQHGDVDFWGIAPVVAICAIVLIPILCWSDSFKTNSGKVILLYWSILIFVSFAIVCYYTVNLDYWDIDRVWSVASCDKDCPRPLERAFPAEVIPWSMEDYNNCHCVDYCGLLNPTAPLRNNQGMAPQLSYSLTLSYYCTDRDCDEAKGGAVVLLNIVVYFWIFFLIMGLLALLSVNSDSESVRNAIFRVVNAGRQDITSFVFKGRRQQRTLRRMHVQGPHNSQRIYRRLRRLIAKLIATLYYGLAFFSLVASPFFFVLSIVAFEFWIGAYSTSEHSDAVGSWAPVSNFQSYLCAYLA